MHMIKLQIVSKLNILPYTKSLQTSFGATTIRSQTNKQRNKKKKTHTHVHFKNVKYDTPHKVSLRNGRRYTASAAPVCPVNNTFSASLKYSWGDSTETTVASFYFDELVGTQAAVGNWRGLALLSQGYLIKRCSLCTDTSSSSSTACVPVAAGPGHTHGWSWERSTEYSFY